MVLTYLTHPLVVAAIISFFAGSFGYVITVLVIRPLMDYHRLRRDIRNAIDALAAAPSRGGDASFTALALRLTASCRENLPQWYLLSLKNRGERPQEAAKDLTRLAKTRDGDQVMQRIAAIASALRLKLRHL